ncbi:MAG: hypothetical protein M3R15_19270 [Acidobacteriota bacterium]|nr:hypothetical protein [Acidobacteriota bacterium]
MSFLAFGVVLLVLGWTLIRGGSGDTMTRGGVDRS